MTKREQLERRLKLKEVDLMDKKVEYEQYRDQLIREGRT